MNVYAETNFVLELTFQQEQHTSCEEILRFCEKGDIKLIIPAYCLAEPHEKLNRQYKSRQELQQALNAELRQLVRTSSYSARISSLQEVSSLIVQSNFEEKQRFAHYRARLLKISTIIPLTAENLRAASEHESAYQLTPQDAIVYASVIQHLKQQTSPQNCFLNRNSKDFDYPDIVDELNNVNCKMIPRFDQGYEYIRKQLQLEHKGGKK
jgi:predicted nucleic acid-binding protein